MACAHPFQIRNKYFNQSFLPYARKSYYEVPCGYCLNCRIDRRNYLEDMAIIEQNRFHFGAFVTLTFDDAHLSINNVIKDEDNILRPTLRHSDVSNYVKRLRRYFDYHNSWNKTSIRKDFKFICSGEYGELNTNRCHYHFIFFGLDYVTALRGFIDCWKNGNVKILPIQNGGIRYVLKYLDKIEKGQQAREKYIDKGIEKPFLCHSIQLGLSYILKNIDDIKAHNYCYLGKNNKRRPLSSYMKNKLLVRSNSYDNIQKIKRKMKNEGIKSVKKTYSLKEINEYKHQQALIRESNLLKKMDKDGLVFKPPTFTFEQMHDIDINAIINHGYICYQDGYTIFYDLDGVQVDKIPF